MKLSPILIALVACIALSAYSKNGSASTRGGATIEGSAIGSCTDDTWRETSTINAPSARGGHTAVWTGAEMIVWGGCAGSITAVCFNTGGRYDPTTDTWTAISTVGAPSARGGHTAVWTGTEMIVWGGGGSGGPVFNGGRYDPATDTWTAISTVGAPTARGGHTAVWTGTEMIVWGRPADTGGRYNPATDTWVATVNAPIGRSLYTAIWSGTEMIVWGGTGLGGFPSFNSGDRYDPVTDSWTATSTVEAPSARFSHTAVWTGTEMIVWGGERDSLNTGGRYNPVTDRWVVTSNTYAPTGRSYHQAVWTGAEMIVWGGGSRTGGRYDPAMDTWTATSLLGAPVYPPDDPTAVWTGSEMIVWGGSFGCDKFGCYYTNTGARYCASVR